MEGPDVLVDWGLKSTGRADNRKSSRALDKLIERFQPDILILEDWDSTGSRRCERVDRLLSRIASRDKRQPGVRLVNSRKLRLIGPAAQTNTKYGRALLPSARFPEVHPFLPPIRKPWMPEDNRMAIFDALGFALAYFST
jgi:hypothetical protein